VLHADDGYSRRGSFGSLLVHSMFLMYSPDGTNICGLRGGDFFRIGRCRGLTVVKSCS